MDQLSLKLFFLEATANGLVAVSFVFILALIVLGLVWKRN